MIDRPNILILGPHTIIEGDFDHVIHLGKLMNPLQPVLERPVVLLQFRVVVGAEGLPVFVVKVSVVEYLKVIRNGKFLDSLRPKHRGIGIVAGSGQLPFAIHGYGVFRVDRGNGRETAAAEDRGGRRIVLVGSGQHRTEYRDPVAKVLNMRKILLIRLIVGKVAPVVDQVLGNPINAPVLGVVALVKLAHHIEPVLIIRFPCEGAIERLAFLIPEIMKALPFLQLHRNPTCHSLVDWNIQIKGKGVLVKGSITVFHFATALKISALRDQIRIPANIIGGPVDRTGRSLDDVHRLNGIEIDRDAVAVRGHPAAHAIDEQVGDLTTQIRRGRCPEIGLRIRG